MKLCSRLLIIGLLLGGILTHAQSLSIRASESVAPGGTTSVEILQSFPEGQTPLIVQWDLIFPARTLTLDANYPVISEAAKGAGKNVHCRGSWKKAPTEYLLRCIVAGGQNTIPDGVIASLRFTVAPVRQSTRIPLAIENVDVLLKGMRRVKGKKFETALTVKP